MKSIEEIKHVIAIYQREKDECLENAGEVEDQEEYDFWREEALERDLKIEELQWVLDEKAINSQNQ